MSALGAHVASTLGAFRATTLGARGPGEEPALTEHTFLIQKFNQAHVLNINTQNWDAIPLSGGPFEYIKYLGNHAYLGPGYIYLGLGFADENTRFFSTSGPDVDLNNGDNLFRGGPIIFDFATQLTTQDRGGVEGGADALMSDGDNVYSIRERVTGSTLEPRSIVIFQRNASSWDEVYPLDPNANEVRSLNGILTNGIHLSGSMYILANYGEPDPTQIGLQCPYGATFYKWTGGVPVIVDDAKVPTTGFPFNEAYRWFTDTTARPRLERFGNEIFAIGFENTGSNVFVKCVIATNGNTVRRAFTPQSGEVVGFGIDEVTGYLALCGTFTGEFEEFPGITVDRLAFYDGTTVIPWQGPPALPATPSQLSGYRRFTTIPGAVPTVNLPGNEELHAAIGTPFQYQFTGTNIVDWWLERTSSGASVLPDATLDQTGLFDWPNPTPSGSPLNRSFRNFYTATANASIWNIQGPWRLWISADVPVLPPMSGTESDGFYGQNFTLVQGVGLLEYEIVSSDIPDASVSVTAVSVDKRIYRVSVNSPTAPTGIYEIVVRATNLIGSGEGTLTLDWTMP